MVWVCGVLAFVLQYQNAWDSEPETILENSHSEAGSSAPSTLNSSHGNPKSYTLHPAPYTLNPKP